MDEETYIGEIHNSIPLGIFKELEKENSDYIKVFNVQKPSRVFLEGESSNYWNNTEDFIITGSYDGGEIIIGQVVSCSSKNYSYNKMEKQLNFFETNYQNQFHEYPLKNLLKAKFIVAVNIPSQIVRNTEKRIEKQVSKGEKYELELIVKELPPLEESRMKDPHIGQRRFEVVDEFDKSQIE